MNSLKRAVGGFLAVVVIGIIKFGAKLGLIAWIVGSSNDSSQVSTYHDWNPNPSLTAAAYVDLGTLDDSKTLASAGPVPLRFYAYNTDTGEEKKFKHVEFRIDSVGGKPDTWHPMPFVKAEGNGEDEDASDAYEVKLAFAKGKHDVKFRAESETGEKFELTGWIVESE